MTQQATRKLPDELDDLKDDLNMDQDHTVQDDLSVDRAIDPPIENEYSNEYSSEGITEEYSVTHSPHTELDKDLLTSVDVDTPRVDDDDEFVLDENLSFGEILRKTREQQHLSIEETANALFLERRIIEALENEDYSQLPPPIYVQGYLRSYAKHLKLPIEKILNNYKEAHSSAAPPELGPETTGQAQSMNAASTGNGGTWWKMMTIIIVVGLLALMAWRFVSQADNKFWESWFTPSDNGGEFVQPPILNADGEVSNELTLPPPVESSSPVPIEGDSETTLPMPIETSTAPESTTEEAPATESAETEAANTEDTAEAPEAATETAAETATETEAPSSTEPESTETASAEDNAPEATEVAAGEEANTPAVEGNNTPWMVLQFKGESWTSIKDSKGKRLYYGISKADETTTIYEGTPPFRLVLGKPELVDLEYRGQAVDLSGYGGRVARLKLGEDDAE